MFQKPEGKKDSIQQAQASSSPLVYSSHAILIRCGFTAPNAFQSFCYLFYATIGFTEFIDQRWRHQVRPKTDQLPKLDKGRPQLFAGIPDSFDVSIGLSMGLVFRMNLVPGMLRRSTRSSNPYFTRIMTIFLKRPKHIKVLNPFRFP
jgi:hypothetical protein